MTTSKTRKKLDLSITILIVIGIIIVVNYLAYQIFYRWDLTEGNNFSISKVSKKSISDLDDVVTIKAYFSELPSQYITLRQEVGDLLDEYQNYSGGKVRVEFITPENNETTERDLYMKGIPALQFNVLEKDKYQVVKGYMGIVISYADKSEAIPVVDNVSSLEYQLTTAIKKLTTDDMAKIGYFSGNEVLSLDKEISTAYRKLTEIYDVVQVDLEKEKEVPAGVKTLVIAGPKSKISDEVLKKVDAFVMKGGKLLLMADSIKVEEGLQAKTNDININKLIEKYGAKVNSDLVLDVNNGMASFNQGFITFSTNYPYWPKVVKDGFDKENAAVSNLESALFPWSSSVEILQDKLGDKKVSYLARTTDRGWHVTESFDITPQGRLTPPNERKQYNLAVMITGSFDSAFPEGKKEGENRSPETRIIVVGDSDFAADNFIRNNPDNLILFQNLVDTLSLDDDLINIRSKSLTERPIKELTDAEKAALRYGNVFGVTILVMFAGFLRYYLRKKKRFEEDL